MTDSVAQPTSLGDDDDPDDEDHAWEAEVEPNDPSRPAGDDAGPNPLGQIRNLLPGGKWVLGKAPIVHSPTELEDELLPALFEMPPTLVILSGNAGDGKTAFIESVLERAGAIKPTMAGELRPRVPNDSEVSLDGRRYLVVLDGSEDTYTKSNAQLLDEALGQFGGDEEVEPERGTLIAVNKGRLLSFLEAERQQYGALWDLAIRRFADGIEDPSSRYLLIDLNDRTVVGPDGERSLFGGVLAKLLDWEGWRECPTCEAFGACPVMFNVDALRREQVRERLWGLFALIDLDDRLHVTARHAVTRLASIISGGMRCPDVRQAVRERTPFPHRAYFYGGTFLGRADESSVEEAILNGVSAAYDPSETADPSRDRVIGAAIASGSIRDVVPVVEGEPDSDLPALDAEATSLATRTVDTPLAPGGVEYREAHLALMAKVLRRRYFLGDPEDTQPVRAFPAYLQIVRAQEPRDLVRRLIRSLNATLGIDRGQSSLVVPREYARGLSGSGFALQIPDEYFAAAPGTGLGKPFRESRFTRSWPRSVLLEAGERGLVVASLSIPLLMLEILDRSDRGFRPTSRTERSFMVRVATFYRRLAEHRWSDSLDYVLYEHGRVRAGVNLADGNLSFWLP